MYAVEHKTILAIYRDPRIHFVLNCASAGCPVLRPELPGGDEREELLVDATRDFVNDERNVRVVHDERKIVLSTIFRWYRNDFVNDLRRRGLPVDAGVPGYIAEAVSRQLRAELARADGYSTVFEDYDRAINQQEY